MRKSIAVKPKKRGRPATGKDPFVGVRLPDEMIKALDHWAEKNATTRSEAIRRLVEEGLKHGLRSPKLGDVTTSGPAEPPSLWPMPTEVERVLGTGSPKAASKASDMA